MSDSVNGIGRSNAYTSFLAQLEYQANAVFTKLDTDKDGQISKFEFDTYAQKSGLKNADQIFAKIDLNNDGIRAWPRNS